MTEELPEALRRNVQRLALTGFDTEFSLHLILHIHDVQRARRFLGRLRDANWIKHAASDPHNNHPLMSDGRDDVAVNIGFTARGLRELGVGPDVLGALERLAPAYYEGAPGRAAAHLGDTGASASDYWDEPFAAVRAHVLISIHADTEAAVKEALKRLRSLEDDEGGLRGWDTGFWGEQLTRGQDIHGRSLRTAHFGFRDGIAQPTIRPGSGGQLHAAGELLLGYSNDAAFDLWSGLPDASLVDFFRDGSFAAFRRIEQDEVAFKKFFADTKKELATQGVEVTPEYLMAKLCGRWPNGAPLGPDDTTEPDLPPPEISDAFDFRDDPHGIACPFGSHIRRTNPRKGPAVHQRARPIFRRGMPYGPPSDGDNGAVERGLLGLFFCASLEDQFEHVMAEWINKVPIGPDDRGDAKDPLVGQHDDPHAEYDIPRRGVPHLRLPGLKPFTTTRGTLYAFFPSLRAIDAIAQSGRAAETTSEPAARALAAPTEGLSGAARARTVAKPPVVPQGEIRADTAPVDRFCDIVMEGGITSGILYPPAIVELAKAYRFKNIAGTSVGAFAAAVTAAAEFRRRSGFIDGFQVVGRLPKLLAQEAAGESHLFWMLQPEPQTRRLFNVFVAGLNLASWTKRIGVGVCAALKEYRRAAWLGVIAASLLFGTGLAILGVIGFGGLLLEGWFTFVLGLVAILGALTAYVALAVTAALIGVLIAAIWDVLHGLVPNGFGLCRGGPQLKGENDPTDPAPAALPLTVSLHNLIQQCAGRHGPEAPPLTFEDLWNARGFPPTWIPRTERQRSINLEVYATNLAHSRPYRFPLDEKDDMGRLFFKADELAPYFPPRVMQHLVTYARKYVRGTHSDPPVDNVDDDILELPTEKLPIVVAARLSLSFPLLISAVPLWTIDYEPTQNDRRMKRCWFSDGGLCSNFPIHLFDAFVPRWPTFGISLQKRSKARPAQEVWLPRHHYEGRGDLRSTCDLDAESDDRKSTKIHTKKLGCFLSGLWNAPWRWNDMTMMRMPGVRDRVVRVFLEEGEGGINIRMRSPEILRLAEKYGKAAADAFLEKFVDGDGWDEHRWVRLNVLLVALRNRVAQLRIAINQRHHATPLRQQVHAAQTVPPLDGAGREVIPAEQASELLHLIDALEQFEAAFEQAGDTKPYEPQPQPALRIRHPT